MALQQITHQNINKLCRICLEGKPELYSLITTVLEFSSVDNLFDSKVSKPISEVLQKVTNTDVNSEKGRPNAVCTKCIELLTSAYLFKLKFQESTTALNNFFTNGLSQDPLRTDNHNETLIKQELAENFSENDEATRLVSKSETSARKAPCKSSKKSAILHECPKCLARMPALKLREHVRTHSNLKRYIQIPKEKQVSSLARFVANPREDTPSFFQVQPILHKCPHCPQSISVSKFREHLVEHYHQSIYKCDKCCRAFKKKNHLSVHLLQHTKSFQYCCQECGKEFILKRNYDGHLLKHKGQLPYACNVCDKRFYNPEHLRRHKFIHTDTMPLDGKYKRSYHCSDCNIVFASIARFNAHICITEHPEKRLETKIYAIPPGKDKNMEKRKALCTVCGASVSDIKQHMMKHTGLRPYPCNLCDKRFATSQRLQRHLMMHSGLKPFMCSICSKRFNDKCNMQVHERSHTSPQRRNKKHICNICNKQFLKKFYLKKHLEEHANII